MGKKLLITLALIIIGLLLSPNNAYAKRILPRVRPSTLTNTITPSGVTRGVTTSVSFRSDRKAVNVKFSGLSDILSVSYVMSYDTDSAPQGLTGTLTAANDDPTIRELVFGTCSANACTYDTGITNARLTITTKLEDGTIVVKPYLLKV